MIKLSAFAIFLLVLGFIALPRTTFLATWIFNTAVVSTVLGGSALLLAIVGFIFVPRIVVAYLFLEAAAGAPASGSTLYWVYMGVAVLFELSTTVGAARNTSND